MMGLGRRWRMFEELEKPDRIVCICLDYLGLGFLLGAGEIVLTSQTPSFPLWKVTVCIVIGVGLICTAQYWPSVKPKLRPSFVSFITTTASNFWLRFFATIVIAGYFIGGGLLYIHRMRSDLDIYVMPRTVTSEQANDLRKYLAQHPPYSVTVWSSVEDREAAEYASRLYLALQRANWDVEQNQFGSSRIAAECAEGMCLRVEWPTKEGAIDPKHLPPHVILRDALRYSNIDLNSDGQLENKGRYAVVLLVGRRPRVIYKRSWMLRLYQSVEPHVENWFMPS